MLYPFSVYWPIGTPGTFNAPLGMSLRFCSINALLAGGLEHANVLPIAVAEDHVRTRLDLRKRRLAWPSRSPGSARFQSRCRPQIDGWNVILESCTFSTFVLSLCEEKDWKHDANATFRATTQPRSAAARPAYLP
jgi:hypothetical protein